MSAVHDVSDGGLAVALAEMALAGRLGATITVPDGMASHAWLFGEDQARYLVVVDEAEADTLQRGADVASIACLRLGTTGGDALTLGQEAPLSLATCAARTRTGCQPS